MQKRHPQLRNIGEFVIKMDDVKRLPLWLQELMSKVIVVKADYAFDRDGIVYQAICAEFEPVPENQQARRYAFVIENDHFRRFA